MKDEGGHISSVPTGGGKVSPRPWHSTDRLLELTVGGENAVSPDGRTIVFAAVKDGTLGIHAWTIPVEGGEPRPLTDASDGAVSGTRLVSRRVFHRLLLRRGQLDAEDHQDEVPPDRNVACGWTGRATGLESSRLATGRQEACLHAPHRRERSVRSDSDCPPGGLGHGDARNGSAGGRLLARVLAARWQETCPRRASRRRGGVVDDGGLPSIFREAAVPVTSAGTTCTCARPAATMRTAGAAGASTPCTTRQRDRRLAGASCQTSKRSHSRLARAINSWKRGSPRNAADDGSRSCRNG